MVLDLPDQARANGDAGGAQPEPLDAGALNAGRGKGGEQSDAAEREARHKEGLAAQ